MILFASGGFILGMFIAFALIGVVTIALPIFVVLHLAVGYTRPKNLDTEPDEGFTYNPDVLNAFLTIADKYHQPGGPATEPDA